MSNVKYGVTFLPTRLGSTEPEARRRASLGGNLFAGNRQEAFIHAGRFPPDCDARIVKITTRPKGWQPASEAPPVGLQVLARLIDGEKCAIMQASWHGKDWISPWSGGKYIAKVTHWRHLPKPPKDGQ